MGRHKEEAEDCRRQRGAVVIVIRPAVTHYYCLVTREREGQQKQSLSVEIHQLVSYDKWQPQTKLGGYSSKGAFSKSK